MITSQRPETALMTRGICVLLLAIAGCGQTSQPGGAAQKGAETSATFDQLAAQGVEDPVTSLMTTLRQDPTVSDVTLSPDAATIVVTLQSGDIFNVLTDQADRPEWQEVLFTTAKTAGQVTQQTFDPEQEIICDTTTYPQSKQALLILNFRADLHDR